MTRNKGLTLILAVLLTLVLLGSLSALAASNTVPVSRLDEDTFGISPNDLKPSNCTMNLTNIQTGAGLVFGTAANDLIMGSAGGDIILGAGGDDCIVAGGGNDNMIGGAGTDVCLGGPGTDAFPLGGCETQIQ